MTAEPRKNPRGRILVAQASKHGSTAEIAAAIAEELGGAGLDVELLPADDVRDISGYDALVIGSAIYMGRWLRPARRLLKHREAELRHKPLWLFSSGPCGREDADFEAAEPPAVKVAAERLGARGHVVFGGRLPVDPGTFVERALVRNAPADRRDLRDWDEIHLWGAKIALALAVESRARVDQRHVAGADGQHGDALHDQHEGHVVHRDRSSRASGKPS